MQVAVTFVMMDIVGSRRIQQAIRARVGDKADQVYHKRVREPCWERVKGRLINDGGRINDDVGDQLTAYFDRANVALASIVKLQREMQTSPIRVPKRSGNLRLELRTAIGFGTMESATYQKPGTLPVGALSDLARVLAIAQRGQVLVTEDWQERAGKLAGTSFHQWPDVLLPKENETTTVFELLWDDRKPRLPKQPDTGGNTRVFDILLSDYLSNARPLATLKLRVEWDRWFDSCAVEPEVFANVYELKGKYITVITVEVNWSSEKLTGWDEGLINSDAHLACLGPYKSIGLAKLAAKEWRGEVVKSIIIDNYVDQQTHTLLGLVQPKQKRRRRTNG